MSIDYKKHATTPEVWAVIMASHRQKEITTATQVRP
jgi:hypothetical protein